MESAVDQRILSASQSLRGYGPALWWLVILTMLGDIALTFYGLSLNLVETNPLAAYVITEYGLAGMFGLKSVALLVAVSGWAILPAVYARFVPLFVALPWAFACLVNGALVMFVLT
jgi:hypothetical protein